MPRYIDIEPYEKHGHACMLYAEEGRRLLQILTSDIPTADVVEVVRCEKCIYYAETKGKDSGKPLGYGQCKRIFGTTAIIGYDDFCSYGERRSDG